MFETLCMAEKNTSTLLIVTNLRRMEDVGLQVQTVPVFFLFVSLSYPLAFYCLFSLLTLLASRDFCEDVFLV